MKQQFPVNDRSLCFSDQRAKVIPPSGSQQSVNPPGKMTRGGRAVPARDQRAALEAQTYGLSKHQQGVFFVCLFV